MSEAATQTRRREKLTKADIEAAAERLKNWGKWGPDDEVGTLNYTTPDDIVRAAGLVRKGQVFSLALNYDDKGPQGGKTKFPPVGRFNPVHTMLRTGTDAYSGILDKRGIRSAISSMATTCGTATIAVSCRRHRRYGRAHPNGCRPAAG